MSGQPAPMPRTWQCGAHGCRLALHAGPERAIIARLFRPGTQPRLASLIMRHPWSPVTGKCMARVRRTPGTSRRLQRSSRPSHPPPAWSARRFPYLHDVQRLLRDADVPIELGAQDVSAEAQGAYHGRGVRGDAAGYRLHLRHRGPLGAARVVSRGRQARRAQVRRGAIKELIPILCVGEQLAEREAGLTQAVISRQLDAVLELSGAPALWLRSSPMSRAGQSARAATRPRSRRRTSTRSSARGSRHGMLKLPPRHASCMAAASRPEMRRELFAMPDVDGGLIGGASLKADEFVAILAALSR